MQQSETNYGLMKLWDLARFWLDGATAAIIIVYFVRHVLSNPYLRGKYRRISVVLLLGQSQILCKLNLG